jgi:threonine dehydrogenase-like Zn-dependent dehydrogenase
MFRWLLVLMIAHGEFDLSPLVMHRFRLDEIGGSYELFRNRPEPVFKVGIRPQPRETTPG